MLDTTTTLYSYKDITILPAVTTQVASRRDVEPSYGDGFLPIFTAPMSTVVNAFNAKDFKQNGIIPIFPRNLPLEDRLSRMSRSIDWVAFSLSEFNQHFVERGVKITRPYHVLIDVANGHMQCIYDSVKKAKKINPAMVVMVGNIANPETYLECCKSGVDFVRVGIGSGNGCITSTNTAIHMPMASLIAEVYGKKKYVKEHKDEFTTVTKIVADGGIRSYSDVIKAIMLGADYVMIGGLLSQCVEACGLVMHKGKLYDYHDKKVVGKITLDGEWQRVFYGMASEQGQSDLGNRIKKTPEGICKYLPIKYTLRQWSLEMKDYLRSSMSYLNIDSLSGINRENIRIGVMSPIAQLSINQTNNQ